MKSVKKIKALCIVAHPDDETIWMGGKILKEKDWDWTILSLCRGDDRDRMPKFKKVCRIYGAKAVISDLDDEKLNPLAVSEIINKIKENLHSGNYDYIFTHGKNGEYGHLRHKEIHKAVKKMVYSGELNCKGLYCFSYSSGGESAFHDPNLKIPVAKKSSDLFLELEDVQHNLKKEIVRDIYGYPNENSFELKSCGRWEAFVTR